MNMGMRGIVAGACLLAAAGATAGTPPAPPPDDLVPREFRAAWVATVVNLDWPSRSSLTTSQARAELQAIVSTAASMRLNALVFQVRSECDAMYPSTIEPWSRYLTGSQGTAPSPAWDPLQEVLDLAHARGMEVHAWFNPYRAGVSSGSSFHSTHVSRTNPDLVVDYGGYKWLNPGDPEVQDYSRSVIMDVVSRYDVDGVHFDDYFYPYPTSEEFPDAGTYQAYLNGGGTLDKADWRRDSVNTFIRDVYNDIRAEKDHVQFGISPFGIWRPGNPPGIAGFDAYASLYADSRLWLREGWLDYLTPQIYWEIDPPAQSYTALMDWWISENVQDREIWPGLANYKTSGSTNWPPEEIVRQVEETQARSGATGNVHFRMEWLQNNIDGQRTLLMNGPYSQQALRPPMPWLDDVAPAPPDVTITDNLVQWTPVDPADVRNYVFYQYRNSAWEYVILNAASTQRVISGSVEGVVVTAVDRLGNESEKTVVDPTPATDPLGWTVY